MRVFKATLGEALSLIADPALRRVLRPSEDLSILKWHCWKCSAGIRMVLPDTVSRDGVRKLLLTEGDQAPLCKRVVPAVDTEETVLL